MAIACEGHRGSALNSGLGMVSPKSTFAIAYTVKNEARLLPEAIRFHLAAGCSRIYVFWDGTTDNSRELVAGFARVHSQESVRPYELANRSDWLERFGRFWEAEMDVRKAVNTYYAAQLAEQEGIDWLISIDPDEILAIEKDRPITDDSIREFLSGIPDRIDQVLVRNLELVPPPGGSGDPFRECTLFLNRFPGTEVIWRYSSAAFRRIVRVPGIQAWYDHCFYRVRFLGALPRLMRHPVTQEAIPASYFMGYSNHKAFVRVPAAKDFDFITHKWIKFRRKPRSIKKGILLHYDFFDVDYLCAKFQQRPEMIKAFYCRYKIARIARELPRPDIERFFDENLAIKDQRRVELLVRKKILVRVAVASEFIASLDRPAERSRLEPAQ